MPGTDGPRSTEVTRYLDYLHTASKTIQGVNKKDWVAGAASLRGGVGAKAPINREWAGSLAVRQEV